MDTIVGTRLGAYLVEKRLGQGGMATVFIAVQPSTGRKVAIKTLPKSQLSDPKAVTRFEREARVLASLQHPHILPLIDYGEAGEYKYLVVPYLAHGDLEDRLQRVLGPLDLAESRRLLTQLAEALDHAHSQGVIHRDLKPGNVLLDGQGNAMLADFGIAHQAGSDRLTGVGFTVGTPEYMAPEQVNGQAEARSDLYALGVLAFRLLTGVLPFKGANPTATLLLQRDTAAPDARSINPRLSVEIGAFLSRALAKDVGQRFQSGALFAQAVRAVLPETSPSAQHTTEHLERPALVSEMAPDVLTQGHLTAPGMPLSAAAAASSTGRREPSVFVESAVQTQDMAVLMAPAAQADVRESAQVTMQRPVVRMPAVPPSVRATVSAPPRIAAWPWIVMGLLLLALLFAIWAWLGSDRSVEQNSAIGEALAPPVAATVRAPAADPAPQYRMYDDFAGTSIAERWQAVGGLSATVTRGRLRLEADRPQQWLRAIAAPEFVAASVLVKLERAAGVATEAAAGLTVSRGQWWLSCHVYRYALSGQLEPVCLENDVEVYRGAALADEVHEVAIIAARDGSYHFQLDGRTATRLTPRSAVPQQPLALVLSLWTRVSGARVAAVFAELRLAAQ
jgi:serine/threonine-protein kinase